MCNRAAIASASVVRSQPGLCSDPFTALLLACGAPTAFQSASPSTSIIQKHTSFFGLFFFLFVSFCCVFLFGLVAGRELGYGRGTNGNGPL